MIARGRARCVTLAVAGLAALAVGARPALAQGCALRITTADRASQWAPPLDRIVSLRLPELAVREALDRVVAAVGVEVSYSADLLPLDRRVCLALDRVPVGAVLESLLQGSTLRPIVLGTSQVVLAPTRAPAVTASTTLLARRTSVLDRVVVTGSPDGAPQRGSPFALEVLDGAVLAEHGVTTLGEALDLSVPGIWTWSATAGAVTGRYGSIRGASSFGVSAPKLYLDGIEVANPLLVTQLDPARIARVEVIRGPQGAALYGADAISGVVNIITRFDGTSDGRTERQVSVAAGVSNTAFASRDPLVQDHALSLRRGSPARSLGMGLTLGTVGAFVPGASERRLLADANARVTRDHAVVSGTARLSWQQANATTGLMLDEGAPALAIGVAEALSPVAARRNVWSPVRGVTVDTLRPRLPRDSVAFGVAGDSASGQDVVHYTIGGSVAMMPSLQWTHTIIAGVDGYRLRGLSAAALPGPLTSGSGAGLGDSDGAADRGSLRFRSVGRYDVAPGALFTVTLGAEQAITREVLDRAMISQPLLPSGGGAGVSGPLAGARAALRRESTTYANSGVLAQGVMAWHDRWFLSAGARLERTTGATPLPQQSLLPMLGAAHVRDLGPATVKLRGAYGTGIRPARTLLRNASWMGASTWESAASLDAERQSGTEFGADLLVSSRLSLRITRFDQRASGLIQPVSSVVTSVASTGRLVRSMTYTLQNVGAITNRGWEIDASTRVGRVSLGGAMSLVDSRVAQVAPGYRGELRVGDRMLDVPSSTASVSAAWPAGRWTFTTAAIRAADWVGYDRGAIATALARTGLEPTAAGSRALEGPQLRRFWTTYRGVTRWRAGISYRIRSGLTMQASGDNLLNVQTGAPDNTTVITGRTMTLGVRTQF
jgi:iron complex outermembrane receptor protein